MAMSLPLSNKVIAVTGAASGIALATSKILFERGASLSLADLQKDRLDANVATITGGSSDAESRILTTAVDVRSSDSVDQWIKKTIDKFGRLDGAANLAGVIGANVG
jgi:NAD(P)-dependent dehydrogenase (short-subunit alcohol dehydrogenase family)